MNLQVETPWIFEECFNEQFIDLLSSHLLDCCNFLFDKVETKFFLFDLEPIHAGLLGKALILLLQLVNYSKFVLLHNFVTESTSLFRAALLQEFVYPMLKEIHVFSTRLNQEPEVNDLKVVLGISIDDIAELLISPQLIESGFGDEGTKNLSDRYHFTI